MCYISHAIAIISDESNTSPFTLQRAHAGSYAGYQDTNANTAWRACPTCDRSVSNPASLPAPPPHGVHNTPPRVDGEPVGPQGHPVSETAPLMVFPRRLGCGIDPKRCGVFW